MDAKLIGYNEHGLELRHCTSKAQTWPGYHESAPLGKTGLWAGNAQRHTLVSREEAEGMGFDLNDAPDPNPGEVYRAQCNLCGRVVDHRKSESICPECGRRSSFTLIR